MKCDEIEVNSLTPMLRQYYELKAQAGDAVLFFRMGDFYELFGKDAETVAPLLQLVLTSRERGDKNKIAFCGVPHHSAKNYYIKLLQKGFKIAVADQVSDPSEGKGLVERQIVARFSPGCIDELDALDGDRPNYILALHQRPDQSKWAVLLIDISTAEIKIAELESGEDISELVKKYKPKELWTRQFFIPQIQTILRDYLSQDSLLFSSLSEATLRDDATQKNILKAVFCDELKPVMKVSGGRELLATVLSQIAGMGFSTTRFLSVQDLNEKDSMELSENVVRDLEVFETQMRRERRGSLISVIDFTMSAMGSRTLRQNLMAPLLDANEIVRRHDFVAAAVTLGQPKLHELREILQGIPDVRRLLTRVMTGRVSAEELWQLGWASQKIAHFVDELQSFDCLKRLQFIADMSELSKSLKVIASLVDKALGLSNPLDREKQSIFRPGYDTSLDAILHKLMNGQSLIEEYVQKERQKTGIGSLKSRKHKTFGLLLDVTKTHAKKVPDYFIRRQTMVNGERFSTVELDQLCIQLENAVQLCEERQTELFGDLVKSLVNEYKRASDAVAYFGTIDMLMSFAWLSLKDNWVRPKLSLDGVLDLKMSRHPVIEQFIGRHNFTPNDVCLKPTHKNMLITGPNMAGKSTVMRQVAVTALLCQIGCFVPATQAEIPVFDNIFTRVGASDNLVAGQSTFMVEMSEAAHILRHATSKSLVVLDEIGRGTSTQDGLAIASAIFASLAKKVGCYTMFATHYHELVAFSSRFSNVQIFQTLVTDNNETIEFSHRLVPGASGHSYGIEVAKLAGIPPMVIEDAKSFLNGAQEFTNAIQPLNFAETPTTPAEFESRPLEQSFQFESSRVSPDHLSHIVERLEMLKIHKTTPLQALVILNDLKSLLGTEVQQAEFNFHPEAHA